MPTIAAARRASNAITPSTRTASRPSSGGAPNSRAPAATSGGAGSIGAATGAAVVPERAYRKQKRAKDERGSRRPCARRRRRICAGRDGVEA
jgi:hypothetical protein